MACALLPSSGDRFVPYHSHNPLCRDGLWRVVEPPFHSNAPPGVAPLTCACSVYVTGKFLLDFVMFGSLLTVLALHATITQFLWIYKNSDCLKFEVTFYLMFDAVNKIKLIHRLEVVALASNAKRLQSLVIYSPILFSW